MGTASVPKSSKYNIMLLTSTINKMLKHRKNLKTFSIFRMIIFRVNVTDVPLLAVNPGSAKSPA
jgi:hypothetical protein